MLEAIISFLPSEGNGAIGALDWTPEERKKLAEESLSFVCPICGRAQDLLTNSESDEVAPLDPSIAEQISQLSMGKIPVDAEIDPPFAEAPANQRTPPATSSSSEGDVQSTQSSSAIKNETQSRSGESESPRKEPQRDWMDDILWGMLILIGVLIAILLYRIISRFSSK